MRYRIGVKSQDDANAASVLDAFQKAVEGKFSGLEFEMVQGQLMISCPDRATKQQVREFIKTESSVQEPEIPKPTYFP